MGFLARSTLFFCALFAFSAAAEEDLTWPEWYVVRRTELKGALDILENFDRQCRHEKPEDKNSPYESGDFENHKNQIIKASENSYSKFGELAGFRDAFKGCYENNGPDSGSYVIKDCAESRIKTWIEKFKSARAEALRRSHVPLDEKGDPISSTAHAGSGSGVPQQAPQGYAPGSH